jgi:hypothetical protein
MLFCFVFNLLFCISATTLGCIHVYIYICVDIYCCLIRTTCRSGAFKSRSRNGKKSACVTQGIIIKIDARLCGLFQFRHEAHTHQQLQLLDTRSMIEIMQSENLVLMLDRKKSREREKEKVFFFTLFFSRLIRKRKKKRERMGESEA